MADVKMRGRCMVKGSGSPWTGTVKLGEWDKMVTTAYVPTIYFYTPPSREWTTSKLVETLKDSLAQALFYFYPFAGRVHQGPTGIPELRCENQGAEVTEAESSSELADFGDFSSCFSMFKSLIPIVDPMVKPLHELPLVSVQLTRFRCGGISIGLVANHGISDGMAAYHFITEWARLACGESLQTPPVHDRSLLRAGEPPKGPGFIDPAVLEDHPLSTKVDGGMPPMKETTVITLPLTKLQMDKLKSIANESSDDTSNPKSRPFSRYEVLTAHLWRCMCKVKGHEGEEEKALGITLDARSRVNPPLPREYFGNAVLMVAAGIKARELVHRPLGFACRRIRESIEKVNDEYVQTDIDYLKRAGKVVVWRGLRNPLDLSLAIPELWVISWLTLPLLAIDFGWGNYVHMSPNPMLEGLTNIMPGKQGDGSALVFIGLKLEDVDQFKGYFYEHLI